MEAFTIEGRLCKILIVDDEILIRQGIKHYMNWEQEGFTIVGEAANGQEALEMIERCGPDIVITDIVMPVMDGEELTKAIKTRYPEIEVIVLSSFGEFEYVRNTFQSGGADYILKPRLEPKELLHVLNRAIGRTEARPEPVRFAKTPAAAAERLLEKIAAGFELDGETDRADIRASFPHPVFRVLAVAGKQVDPEEAEAFKAKVGERYPASICLSFPAGRGMTGFLTNGDGALREPLDDLAEWWAESSDVGTLLIGGPYEDFMRTGDVLREQIRPLARRAFYHPEARRLSWPEHAEQAAPAEKFNLNQFTEAFKLMQFDEAFGGLRRHVETLCASGSLEIEEFKSFLNNMIFTVTVLSENMGYDLRGLDKEKFRYFDSIQQARNAQEAVGTIHAFLETAEARLADAVRSASRDNMKKLLNYIEQNYAEPLSLKEVARHFHFNPTYLSSYFSSHIGEGFVEYVNRIRVSKAAEMLRSGSDSIAEIGAKVGFSDHSYFCKVFKKYTGRSPSEYRRMAAGTARS
jgi:two-component system response regulator YesN